YAATSTEVNAYIAKIVGFADVKAWVFTQADNKVYDTTTAATLSFEGTPTDASAVTLNAGTATFDTKNVGTGKTVTYSGYTLGGTATNLALFTGAGTHLANITPAPLTVTATGTNKVYDGNTTDVVTLAGTPLAGDTVTFANAAANFVDKNVGTAKTVNVTGITLAGADAGNYAANTTTVTTANITPLPLNVSATGTDKVYDGNTTDIVTLAATPIAGDTVTLANTAANFVDKNVGTAKTVNVTGITIAGADAGNYTANTTTATTASITPLPLTVSATGTDKVYDGNTTDIVTLAATPIAGDTVTLANTAANFVDKNVGTAKTVNVTRITIAGADAGNYTANTTTATTASITPLPLTVSATGSDKVFDGTTTATVALADNRIAGDVIGTSYTAANFNTPAVGNDKPIAVTGISTTGTDAGNYTYNTSTTTSANITPVSSTTVPVVLPSGEVVYITPGSTTVPVVLPSGEIVYLPDVSSPVLAEQLTSTGLGSLGVVPVTPFGTNNPAPLVLLKDTQYGGIDAAPIVPFALLGIPTNFVPGLENGFDGGPAATTLFVGPQPAPGLTVVQAPRGQELLALYPVRPLMPYAAPIRRPRQGRN
ncbi:YDG domain-containing protein, partial [Zwartia sp.]|uniref:YDG domain-containing protein n=1 Tax=Zwartia sp. TaxID=2978004 RepID=UPI002728FBEF